MLDRRERAVNAPHGHSRLTNLGSRAAVSPPRPARPEDHAVLRGDVDEVEVDSGPGDLAGQVGEDAGAVLDVDHDYLALAGNREVGDRQGVLRGFGVSHEDVELGPVAWADACGRCDV